MSEPDFDNDPAALAWARAHVEEYMKRLEAFQERSKEEGDVILGLGCGMAARMAKAHFLGAEGVFVERRENP